MLGTMLVTLGYAGQIGYVVRDGQRVKVVQASNHPVIDYFVSPLTQPENSIGASADEVLLDSEFDKQSRPTYWDLIAYPGQ